MEKLNTESWEQQPRLARVAKEGNSLSSPGSSALCFSLVEVVVAQEKHSYFRN